MRADVRGGFETMLTVQMRGPAARRGAAGAALWLLLGALTACGSWAPPKVPAPGASGNVGRSPAPPAPARPQAEARPPAPAPAPVPAPSPLASEARWLSELFGATPVTVQEGSEGSVDLLVPTVHAFEAGANLPKPAIKAVLDRLAQSLLRQPTARLQLTAPAPAARAAALKDHLGARGIPPWRIQASTAPGHTAPVQLKLLPGTTVLKRLDDSGLPAPAPGTVRPPALGRQMPAGR
jgi:hypothetical protein